MTTLLVCGCTALALIGCGSSSNKTSSSTSSTKTAPTASTASTASTGSTASAAASQVCSARDGIETQARALTSLSPASATKANVTTSLNAIKADLQKMKDAQPDLAPARKQQVQDAAATFGTQLTAIVSQTVAGLSKTDAQTEAKKAGASLESAAKKSLQPISC